MKDPFLELHKKIEDTAKGVINKNTSFFIAKVKSPLPNIEVQLNDILLDKDDLLIDKWLLDRNDDLFTENEGHTHGGDTTGSGEHKHQIKSPMQDKLIANDKVILLRIGDKFIVLSKVVAI